MGHQRDDAAHRADPANGPLVTLPYTVELNDIPMMIVQHHESEYFTRRCIDTFDRLFKECEHSAKIMAVAIHPYISGQPYGSSASKRSTTTSPSIPACCT
jgi:allantoinase